jgi:uracil-DNA glycosylase
MINKTITWKDVLKDEKRQSYFQDILAYLKQHTQKEIIYPAASKIFNALKLTPFEKVKVVILGQDPYHGPKQAHGLSFSVQPGIKRPPSLENIFKELKNDLGIEPPMHGCLTAWAKQGVLLLNASLTVKAGSPQSHARIGWHRFTDKIIQTLNQHQKGIVFLLWGASAQRKAPLIDTNKHEILMTTHPSPLSAHRGFIGCRHFSKTNTLLKQMHREPIDWQLIDSDEHF